MRLTDIEHQIDRNVRRLGAFGTPPDFAGGRHGTYLAVEHIEIRCELQHGCQLPVCVEATVEASLAEFTEARGIETANGSIDGEADAPATSESLPRASSRPPAAAARNASIAISSLRRCASRSMRPSF
jgi:hypothetical protein